MKKNYPRYTLRVSREVLEKIGYISKYNGRTKNKEIEYVLKKWIQEYEKANGEIETNYYDDED